MKGVGRETQGPLDRHNILTLSQGWLLLTDSLQDWPRKLLAGASQMVSGVLSTPHISVPPFYGLLYFSSFRDIFISCM